jgi:ribonucleotide reductase alpha subunit
VSHRTERIPDSVVEGAAPIDAQLAEAGAAILDPTPVDDETAGANFQRVTALAKAVATSIGGRRVVSLIYAPKELSRYIDWTRLGHDMMDIGAQLHARRHADGGLSVTIYFDDGEVVATPAGSKGEDYELRREEGALTCTCKGFLYRAKCKHVEEEAAAARTREARG